MALLGPYSDRRYEVMFGFLAGMLIIVLATHYVGKLAGTAPVHITPLILVTVGMYVLSNTALDMLPVT
jgi:hypothetical protein